jgi:hypothetical protein
MGAGRFMRPEALRVLKEESEEECKRYDDMMGVMHTDIPFPPWNRQSTTIMGIEGWEPVERTSNQSKDPLYRRIKENEENTKEARRSLIIVALSILVLLLLYASKVVNDL